MDTPIRLVVGLGNPGSEYQHTRHNAGADFVSALAARYGAVLKKENKFAGGSARISVNGHDIRLLRPETYMNRSGQSVVPMARFYQIPPAAVLVAHDELDLAPGDVRLKLGGGHGGHNGLRDIIQALGNEPGFARLRIGIGHPGHASEVVNFVLRRPPEGERNLIVSGIERALDVIPELATGQWNQAMKALHTRIP